MNDTILLRMESLCESLNNLVVNDAPSKSPNEDLGLTFEKAICLLFDIEYQGNFKYSKKEAERLKNKLIKLNEIYTYQMKHTAKKGNKFDFYDVHGQRHLSAKTTKSKVGKVCPQVIGQTTKLKFCKTFGIENIDVKYIKSFIITNVKMLLSEYLKHTFDCPVLYYNQRNDSIKFITLKSKIDWTETDISFTHINRNKAWNESTTIKINGISIGEFQIHNKRDNVKYRWCFENLLNIYSDNFKVLKIY